MRQSTREQSGRGWSASAAIQDRGSEMPASAAHDFGNMIQLATSAVRITRQRLTADGNPETAAVLGDALDALDRASLIARRILARSSAPRDSQLVSIRTEILSLSRLLHYALGDAILLRITVSDNLPAVVCDPRQLDDALINLAVNARDAMPNGGDLAIEARECTEAAHGPRCIAIEVTDNGCGMPPEVVERAFRPFFTTKGPGQGTGLGLTAVRNFVERWAGSVEIRSSEASGTCVRLHLPASGIS